VVMSGEYIFSVLVPSSNVGKTLAAESRREKVDILKVG
jgi:hypothetical protein